MKDEPRYMGWRTFLRTGNLLDPEFAYHTVPMEIDIFDRETFEKDPTEFHVVCTDIVTGKPVYKQLKTIDYEALEWIRASSSMPLVSIPVELEGKLLLDGGMTDSIPLKYAQEQGFEKNIVILTQPESYRKHASKLPLLFKLLLGKYPQIAETMGRRHLMYNAQKEFIKAEEARGNAMLIYPDEPLNISRTSQNEADMRRVYGLGRQKGKELLAELKSYVESFHVL